MMQIVMYDLRILQSTLIRKTRITLTYNGGHLYHSTQTINYTRRSIGNKKSLNPNNHSHEKVNQYRIRKVTQHQDSNA